MWTTLRVQNICGTKDCGSKVCGLDHGNCKSYGIKDCERADICWNCGIKECEIVILAWKMRN